MHLKILFSCLERSSLLNSSANFVIDFLDVLNVHIHDLNIRLRSKDSLITLLIANLVPLYALIRLQLSWCLFFAGWRRSFYGLVPLVSFGDVMHTGSLGWFLIQLFIGFFEESSWAKITLFSDSLLAGLLVVRFDDVGSPSMLASSSLILEFACDTLGSCRLLWAVVARLASNVAFVILSDNRSSHLPELRSIWLGL